VDLLPYQAVGVEWLAERRHALLADEMGLGKTAQAIAAAALLKAQPVLVLCPAVAKVNWRREFEMWGDERARIISGAGDCGPLNGLRVVVCNYDLLRYPAVRERLLEIRWGLMICDEAHYLKGIEAARTRSVLGPGGLVHQAERVWLLTGTPMPNHPGELWPMLYVFGATAMKYQDFVDRYCVVIGKGREQRIVGMRHAHTEELKEIVHRFTLRRTVKEVAPEMPAIYIEDVVVPAAKLSPEAIQHHFPAIMRRHLEVEDFAKALRETMLKEQAEITDFETLETGIENSIDPLALMESTPTLRRYIGLQKVPAVLEIVTDELTQNPGRKIVLFCQHKAVIDELAAALKKPFGAVTLYGGTPEKKRQERIDAFQNDAGCRVFIGQTVAAGTAITLTAASEVILVESSWVPSDNVQAIKRAHRIGQEMPTRVRNIAIADSIDDAIQRTVTRKTRDALALSLA
jgi:SWI/SNF-related matrix-associated actin-dependent regulator 1 of chromatin subfamily A